MKTYRPSPLITRLISEMTILIEDEGGFSDDLRSVAISLIEQDARVQGITENRGRIGMWLDAAV